MFEQNAFKKAFVSKVSGVVVMRTANKNVNKKKKIKKKSYIGLSITLQTHSNNGPRDRTSEGNAIRLKCLKDEVFSKTRRTHSEKFKTRCKHIRNTLYAM